MSLRNKDKGDLILSVDNLSVDYKTRTARVSAVKDVSFELFRGETYGLVGESGCGKSTVAFAVMGYTARNGQLSKGNVRFKGKEMTTMSQKDLKKIWGAEISMVYQDPDSALNPSIRIGGASIRCTADSWKAFRKGSKGKGYFFVRGGSSYRSASHINPFSPSAQWRYETTGLYCHGFGCGARPSHYG